MRASLSIAIVVLVMCGFLGCSKSGDSAKQSSSAAGSTKREAPGGAASGQHGATGVVQGSYEDWCGEHGVAESMCTRCNSTLVAAFKATGDWCAEHGLPESQCLACNPGLTIQRPPKPTGGM